MSNIGVYLITNINTEKTYVGSSVDIKRRWCQHKSSLRTNKHPNKHLQRAFNKYGEASFSFDILLTCVKEDLIYFEQFMINLFHPKYNGHKIASLSRLGTFQTEEAKRKMSKPAWNKGIKLSPEHVSKGVETRKAMRLQAWNKGKVYSEELRIKISEGHKGQVAWNKGIKTGKTNKPSPKRDLSKEPVVIITKQTLNISNKDLAKILNIRSASTIFEIMKRNKLETGV